MITKISPHRPWRMIVLIIMILLFAFISLAIGCYSWLRTSLPSVAGQLLLQGLGQPVQITRDAHGIPTILAQSDHDAAFALGFVHAQDRLFQMDLMRRFGAGRLSEWFGPATLNSDRLTRTLGIYRAAERQYQFLSPAMHETLTAYAAGNQRLSG